jgi:hypothetical protein
MELLKAIGLKIVGGLTALGVLLAAIAFWQMEPATRQALWTGIGRLLGWTVVVLAVPWVTFAFIGYIARFERNAAGAALVGGYTVAEVAWLVWLFQGVLSGAGWLLVAAAGTLAALYNLLACDWIAEKVV